MAAEKEIIQMSDNQLLAMELVASGQYTPRMGCDWGAEAETIWNLQKTLRGSVAVTFMVLVLLGVQSWGNWIRFP